MLVPNVPPGVDHEASEALRGTRTPRSQSRILISPFDDSLLGNRSILRKLSSDNVVRIDKVVCVASERVGGRRQEPQSEQQYTAREI